jgi:hypothetical protein
MFRPTILPFIFGLLLACSCFGFGATRVLASGYYHPAADQQVFVTHCHARGGGMWISLSTGSVTCP